ncbi:helix-hairpin-helix domain-containing protein [Flammeovirga aprica]|uniref:Kinase n=1 Tax=Flammeovirga aprica JL-4 TaxID=694437 RepID=A0A7X9RWQ9_9BACT|nr:lipopolysaccharide kinase InaA family protein [Flammeovirga aprica]NME70125.1 kinase [Flammeovirga aprica JL-4]
MSKIQVSSIFSGKSYEYIDKIIGSGTMKDVYFSPDKSYVIGFFRTKLDIQAKERLETIVKVYRKNIFEQAGGKYWNQLYCWPYDIVEYKGLWGVVAPAFEKHFFFEHGSVNDDMLQIKGKEKEGKWFASASHQNRFLDDREKGNFLSYLRISLLISRAVRRMHAAGLAHSDLSYKNVLVDPVGMNACIIDIDGLVVPGKFPPDVMGTPDFIAPEVIMTKHLELTDPNRKLPSIHTDRHALAVLIYMYLFYRHPLRGRKIHDEDPTIDEEKTMGSHALFVEHPTDKSNRPDLSQIKKSYLPYADVDALPYSISGPFLKELFDRAFIDGLQDPLARPTADEWEHALVKTVDLLQPCQNPKCSHKWFVFDNKTKPKCPYCQTEYKGMLPVLNFYSSRGNNNFRPDNYRLMVYNNQYLYQWHVNRKIFPNEKLDDTKKDPVGYFVFHQNKWLLVNQKLDNLMDMTDSKNPTKIAIGKPVEIKDNAKILLSNEDGGRLILVQMVNN